MKSKWRTPLIRPWTSSVASTSLLTTPAPFTWPKRNHAYETLWPDEQYQHQGDLHVVSHLRSEGVCGGWCGGWGGWGEGFARNGMWHTDRSFVLRDLQFANSDGSKISQEGAPTLRRGGLLFSQIFLRTAWKWRKLAREGWGASEICFCTSATCSHWTDTGNTKRSPQ